MENLLDFFQKKIIRIGDDSFRGIRDRVFVFTALFLLVLGLGSTSFNLFFTISNNAYVEAAIFILTYAVLIIAIFGRFITFNIRISMVVFFLYTTGVMIMAKWGLHSSGQFFLFLIPIIAAIFSAKNLMILFLVANGMTFTYLRVLVIMELLKYPDIVKFGSNDWLIFAIGFMFVNTFVAFFLYYLINMLVDQTDEEQVEIENLSHEMEKLGRVNMKFQSMLEEHKEFKDQEFRSQRMESVGRLTNGIAHEFNNFITVIVGYTDILISISNNDEMYNKLLKKIKVTSQAAEKLVSKLLAFSKNLVMKNQIINVNDIVLNLKDDLDKKVQDNVIIKLNLPDENYLIKIDPQQLQNIIKEIVTNSDHALPKGGEIKITVSTVLLNTEYAKTHGLEKDGEYVTITIEDNGIGMDSETLVHIFEPFFSTKGGGDSLGLGMSVIYGIVKQCSGDVEVFSDPGEGTKVVLYFLSRQEKLAFKKNDKIIPSDLKGGEKILLVEDDKLVRSVIVEVLNNYGYEMLTASNGQEGFEVFKKYQFDLSLVIADIIMPKMSGIELSQEIEKENPNAKVLFMSGYSEQVNNLEDMGVNYIKKPFDPLDLVKKIRYVLDLKPIMDEGEVTE